MSRKGEVHFVTFGVGHGRSCEGVFTRPNLPRQVGHVSSGFSRLHDLSWNDNRLSLVANVSPVPTSDQ